MTESPDWQTGFLGHRELGAAFYGVVDYGQFTEKLRELLRSVEGTRVFAGDNLITWSKALSFLDDRRFVEAFLRNAETLEEYSLVWRSAVLAWAAKRALHRGGDFVECGAYRGTTARIICDYVDFGAMDRRYYLYDMFEWNKEEHDALPRHGPDLHPYVLRRFADLANVTVVKGRLPDSLSVAQPERISLLHIDLNNAAAEQGVLEALYPRVVAGGLVILDDYGWSAYRAQRAVADAYFAGHDNQVLELPTGQGLVIT